MQYNKIYKTRLGTYKSLIQTDNIRILDTILDLNSVSSYTDCCIVGIVYISTCLKTTIFDKISESQEKIKQTTYISKYIKIFLEDATGRIELRFNNKPFITTGMCLGFIGSLRQNVFVVKEIIFPIQHNAIVEHSELGNKDAILENSNLIENSNLDKSTNLVKNIKVKDKPKKFAIISGLNINSKNKNDMYLKVLIDYLSFKKEIITDIFIIGNFCDDITKFRNLINNLKMNIYIIPEYTDFGCLTFPLLKVHKKIFTKEFCSLSNPSINIIYGSSFCFTSKYIIEDMYKYKPLYTDIIQIGDAYRMHIENKEELKNINQSEYAKEIILDCVNLLIKSRHLCPSAPDTIPVIPYADSEIFFIDQHIDYFIVPNCDISFIEYLDEYKTYVVGVPDFDKTSQLIVLDTGSKDIEIYEFTNENNNF